MLRKLVRNAGAKPVVQVVQTTVLITVIKPVNKTENGKDGNESVSWCELYSVV